MYEGPNCNPKIDTVQIITPAEISEDTTHQTVFDSHANDNVKSHAKSIQEKNNLRDKHFPTEESTSTVHDVNKPQFLQENKATNTFKDFLQTKHANSRHRRSIRRTIFESGVSSDLDDVSFNTKMSDLLTILKDSIKYTLLNRDRSEEMFSRIEISNDHAINTTGLQYQFVYNKRFKTFVDQGLWETRKFFMYAKNGLDHDIFEKLFDQTTLVSHTFGQKTVKTLTKRGNYFRFMYGSTYNGDTFTTIINDLGDFIEYFSHELAKTDLLIPNFDHFSKDMAGGWMDTVTLFIVHTFLRTTYVTMAYFQN